MQGPLVSFPWKKCKSSETEEIPQILTMLIKQLLIHRAVMFCLPLLPKCGQIKQTNKSLQRTFISSSGLLAALEHMVLRVLQGFSSRCGCMSLGCLCSRSNAVERLIFVRRCPSGINWEHPMVRTGLHPVSLGMSPQHWLSWLGALCQPRAQLLLGPTWELCWLFSFGMKKNISGAALSALHCWCHPGSPGRDVSGPGRWAAFGRVLCSLG